MITENVSTLKIHKLTQAQYDRELAAGNIDEYALYLTPDEEIDLSYLVTKDEFDDHKHDDLYYTEDEIDAKFDAIIGEGASETLDTIGEISAAITTNKGILDTLNSAIGNKVNTSDFNSHANDTTKHVGDTDRTNWNAAKTHADSAHAPINAEVNQNAFSNISVGSTTIAADSKTDTLTLVGSNVTLTPDETNDKVTIGITKDNVIAALGYEPPTSSHSHDDKYYTEEEIDATVSVIEDNIADLERKIADLLYEPIAILSFTHNIGIKERGALVTDVALSWATNKTPATLKLDGVSLDPSVTYITFDRLSITWDNNKTWKLDVTDDRNATATKSVSITFANNIYYGVGTVESGFTNDFVTGLSKKLQTSKAYDFTVNPSNQYIYYAVPTRLGTVTFKVGGFEGGFEAPETVSVTNGSGYTENYYVYRSTNPMSASIAVDVT